MRAASSNGDLFIRLTFTVERRANFYADLAAFVAEGIPPYAAMERMRDVAKRRRSMRWLKRLMEKVLRRMQGGGSLAAALKKWVPGEEAAMLLAGESGGRLQASLIELNGLLKNRLQVKSAIWKAVLPSVGMSAVLVGLMAYILQMVIPEARKLVTDSMFAKLTVAPIYFSLGTMFLKGLPYLIAAGVVLAVIVAVSLPRWRPGPVRSWLDRHIPPYTLFSRIQASFYLLTVASMMEAGAPFRQAVESIAALASPWAKVHLRRQLARLAAGQSEADAMQTGMVPWDVEDRLAVYRMLDDFRRVMAVVARDSMSILLGRVGMLSAVISGAVRVALTLFIISTIFAIGEIALEAQSSLSNVQGNQQ